MRAWCITATGGPEVLRQERVSRPSAGPDDVVVHVRAAGVNRADLLQCLGRYPPPPGVDPRIPGLEFAGEVYEVGARVARWCRGDAVMGIIGGGAYAERVRVHGEALLAVPPGLSWCEAGSLPESYLTAWRALDEVAALRAGEIVAIRPATSAVGMAAARVARFLGARTVGLGRDAERLQQILGVGLDGLVAMDDQAGERLAHLMGRRADVLLEMVGGDTTMQALDLLTDEGRAVLLGILDGPAVSMDLGRFLFRRLGLRAMTMRTLPVNRRITLVRDFARRAGPCFTDGGFPPLLAECFPFAEAPDALRRLAAGGAPGRVVMRMD